MPDPVAQKAKYEARLAQLEQDKTRLENKMQAVRDLIADADRKIAAGGAA